MSDTIGAAIRDAAARLGPVSPTPRLDAELLMAHRLGTTREDLLLRSLGEPAPPGYEALVERRLAHEPVAYITGHRGFWTIDLAVGPGVLVPRPDTETLMETAVAEFGRAGPARVLDLGTGSGALLLSALAEWPRASGLGVDRSEAALAIAAANAERLGLADRAQFVRGNWGEGIGERFDLILCNPPYVESGATLPSEVGEYEPAGALFAGEDGLDDYRRLAPQLPALLGPGGIACVELGAGQAPRVEALMHAEGLRTGLRHDLGGHARCLVARL